MVAAGVVDYSCRTATSGEGRPRSTAVNQRPSDQHRDPRDLPNYTLAESARWLGLVEGTLRVWLVGQSYKTQSGTKRGQAVVKPAHTDPLGLSFWNLVECSVLASVRKTHKVSLQRVRRALTYVARELDKPRPLIEQDFVTDGVDLFVERYGKLIAASQHGQLAMREVLEASLTRIERDDAGLAARLFPWSHRPTEPKIVSVDPRVAFGRPVLTSTGITVDSILGRFRAGESIEHLASDYRITQACIEDLVRWAVEPAAA